MFTKRAGHTRQLLRLKGKKINIESKLNFESEGQPCFSYLIMSPRLSIVATVNNWRMYPALLTNSKSCSAQNYFFKIATRLFICTIMQRKEHLFQPNNYTTFTVCILCIFTDIASQAWSLTNGNFDQNRIQIQASLHSMKT